jgi:ring-1,2-phenylacetyl-CoA epoxidase subunit PaaC
MPSLPDMMTPEAEALARAAKGEGHAPDPAHGPALAEWLLRTGDDALILGHRLSEWCGHAPALEEDIALANVALDLIGQAQLWLELAGQVEGRGRDADTLAFRRDAMGFRNVQMLERPNGDYARTLMRQFLFDAWHMELLTVAADCPDTRVAEIAAKARREVAYHLERSADLVVRLGDGSAESHARMAAALEDLWPYAAEVFEVDEVDRTLETAGLMPAPAALRPAWEARLREVLEAATLIVPEGPGFHRGGRQGRHTEHLGYLLAEMQFLQRAYPDAEW